MSGTPRSSNNGGDAVAEVPGKRIPSYLKPTMSSCHVAACGYPRSRKHNSVAPPEATSSAKRGRSIYRASSLPSISPRTPAAAVCSRGTTARTERSPALPISPKPSSEKAFKTPRDGKALPLGKARNVTKITSEKRDAVRATSATVEVKHLEDEIHVVTAAEAPKQEKGFEVEESDSLECTALKANAIDDEMFGSQGKQMSTGPGYEAEETKLELQPESEVEDKAFAEKQANGRNEPTPDHNEVKPGTADKIESRRNRVRALAVAFEIAIAP